MKYHIEVIKSSRYCYINAIADDINKRIGKLCIDLDSEDANRYIDSNNKAAKIIIVHTNSNACGNGIATSLLNKAIELYNNYNLYLSVIPLRSGNKDKDKNDLINFYGKFGFKKYEKDICLTTMIRYSNEV